MKKNRRWRLGNVQTLRDFSRFAAHEIGEGRVLNVELVPEKRNTDQNALIYALYQEIAGQKEDETVQEIRRHCKLHHGVPMLRSSDEEFRYVYDEAIKPLSYEMKLQLMDYFPVTSKMNKRQASEYIDLVIREYAQQGIYIETRSAA